MILATADLHGYLPEIPPCDLFLIGGDVCPMWDHDQDFQAYWLDYDFRNWLKNIPARKIVGIAGNHDFVFDQQPSRVDELGLPWTYLRGSETDFEGLRIYGLPWVPNLPSWAFHASREALADHYDRIPKGTDIVLSHGPAYQYGDLTVPRYGSVHAGCRSVNNMLRRVKPKAFVCGHIHEGYGHYRFQPQHGDAIDIYNVAFVDEDYTPRMRVPDDWTGQPMPPHLEPVLVQVMVDGWQEQTEDSTNPERKVRDPYPHARQSSEPSQGSDTHRDGMVAPNDPEPTPLGAC